MNHSIYNTVKMASYVGSFSLFLTTVIYKQT